MQGPQLAFSDDLHGEKYRGPNETFRDYGYRVASALKDDDDHFTHLSRLLLDQDVLPAGRIQAAAGALWEVTPLNCFASGTMEDSMVDGNGSIMQRLTEAAATMRMGGGIGYDFSPIRPNKDLIRTQHTYASGPVSFMSIYDALCKTIASAGHRRGAQMATLRIDHPDIELFINAKHPSQEQRVLWDLVEKIIDPVARERAWAALQKNLPLTAFNMSIAVTDEFMECLESGEPFPLRFDGRIYRTVDPRALWEMVMRSTWDWGEPGVLFIDTINRMNNLWYCETIATTNPCLASGTLVSTEKGFIPVEEIREGNKIATLLGSGQVETIESHKNLEVFKVCLSDGTEIRATGSHIFHVARDKYFDTETTLSNLKIGDKLRLSPCLMPNNQFSHDRSFPDLTDREYGLVVGAVMGDGCYTEKSVSLGISCSKKERSWTNILASIIPGSSIQNHTAACDKIASTQAIYELDHSPLKRGYSHEKSLPLELLNSNEQFLAGYIDGMISTDGNVHMSKTNPMVRVSSTSKESLMMLKRALSCFGILTRVYSEKAQYPGSKGEIEGREVTRRHQGYVLYLLGSGLRTLYDRIGITHPDRMARLRTLVLKHNLTGSMWTATIKSIEPDGRADVFDLFEPDSDTWISDGIVNRGCAEQPLPPYGACLLGSMNLVKYIKTQGQRRMFDWDRFGADIPVFVRALDNVIDNAKYPTYEQKKEAQSKRRIGIGVTGMANCIETLTPNGYGSPEFLEMEDHILRRLTRECYLASIQLAKEKGAFRMFDKASYLAGAFISILDDDVKEGIAQYGIRNSHLTSIAPTGTISLCADNVSSGLEPVFAYSFDRDINTANGPIKEKVEDYGYRVFGTLGKTCEHVTPKEHLDVLIMAQGHIDSAVSKTCNVPGSVKWDEFKDLYTDAWRRGAKGLTTFRIDGMRTGIFKATSDDESPTCVIDPNSGQKECG